MRFFFLHVNKDLTTKAFREIEKPVRNNLVRYFVRFGASKRGTQWLIKTEEAPSWDDLQNRGDGWKNKEKTVSRAKT